jgi:DNA-binding NarL/FixJ family response regulator
MRRLPVAVLFNRYPLLLDVLEPILRERLSIAARATDTAEAASLLDAHEPDLLIAGVESGGTHDDVFDLVRDSLTRHPDMKVIAFSSSGDRKLLADAFDAGVSAVVAPNASPDDIAVAIRQATNPSIHFAPTRLPLPTQKEPRTELTERETEIVQLVGKGLSNAEVGRRLLVTEQTVKFHLSNIFRKLNVTNRTQASRRAERMNLLHEDSGADAQSPATAR